MTTIIVGWDDDDRGTQTGTWTTPSPDFRPKPTREWLDEPIDPEGERCVLNGKPYVLYGMWDYAEDWSGEFLREVHPFMLIGAPKLTVEEFRKQVLTIHAERLNAIGSVLRSGENAGTEAHGGGTANTESTN